MATRMKRRPQSEKQPRGRYVYAWFNDESPFPFYVGKGVGDRAWQRHLVSGASAECQRIRSSSTGFWCHIVRDGLTNEGAMLLESALISFFNALGKCEGNQVSPLRRQEVPPLWLEAVMERFRDGRSPESALDGESGALFDADESLEDDSEQLLRKILELLDATEGRGSPCLTLCDIERRLGGMYGRSRIESCMKKNGLNP